MTESYCLCVDAGGTKTAAAIVGETGDVIAVGHGGAANMAELGTPEAAKQILIAVGQAEAIVHASRTTGNGEGGLANGQSGYVCRLPFRKAYIGISGCDSPNDVVQMEAYLSPAFASPIRVMNDAMLLSLLAKPHGSDWCCAVVAGTGSVTLGVKGDDIFARRGGYGYLFIDVGSAYHLGLEGVRLAVMHYEDDPTKTSLLAKTLCERLGVEHVGDLPARIHDVRMDVDPTTAANDRKLVIAELAREVLPLVGRCPVATEALSSTTKDLAKDIATIFNVARAKGLGSGGIAITGGLGVQAVYQTELALQLQKLGVQLDWMERVESPARQCAAALVPRTHA